MSTPHYLRGREQTAYEQMRSAEEISYALLRPGSADEEGILTRCAVEMTREAEARLTAVAEQERLDRENGRIA